MLRIPKEPEAFDVVAKRTVVIQNPVLVKTKNDRLALKGSSLKSNVKVFRFIG